MKIPKLPRSVWIFAGFALLLPLASGGAILAAHARVAIARDSLSRVTTESNQNIEEMKLLAAGRPEPDALRAAAANIDRQCSDALKPALVVAELSMLCDQAGTRVESIRPVLRDAAAVNDPNAISAPAATCILTVRGDCRTIGELLSRMRKATIPMRVLTLEVDAGEDGPEKSFGDVRSTITIEAFRIPPAEVKP